MTDFPAASASLNAALTRIHPSKSPLERICSSLVGAASRPAQRRNYRETVTRSVSGSAGDIGRALESLRRSGPGSALYSSL